MRRISGHLLKEVRVGRKKISDGKQYRAGKKKAFPIHGRTAGGI